ncbi:hypothetical protein CK203_103860 [Vitis vinifera]|uniref:Uncharacterized protein n=1 Tax=Vitis vinifera TaxID=29760 RepID=A0A438C6L7_VITVI|nr:hypothetical protein CK203_103860 [Vitis vinifera]
MRKLQPLEDDCSKLKEGFNKVLRNQPFVARILAVFLHSVVDFLLKLPDIFRTVGAENLKMKDHFAAEHQLDTNQLRHPIGHESNGVVAEESNPESNGVVATATTRDESNGAAAGDGATLHCACHIKYEIAEEAMNFMSYVAEVSRGWDEPNARDMGRMTSQPNVKGEMYILMTA